MTALQSSRLAVRFSGVSASIRFWRTQSYHVLFGLPLGRLQGTSTSWIRVSGSPSLLRFTCLNQKSLFFSNATSTSTSLHFSNISLLLTVCQRNATNASQHPHCSMLVNLCVRAQVSDAWRSTEKPNLENSAPRSVALYSYSIALEVLI